VETCVPLSGVVLGMVLLSWHYSHIKNSHIKIFG
jgi:hypothetical protein